MAEKTENPKATQAEKIENHDSLNDSETVNLSTKLSNIAVVNSSLQTVSKTCHTIKESNSYVGYGMTVAESSLDKAFKAGKAVLDSRTLAPITNTAMENIRYLDKEAGVMVDKLLKSNGKQSEERQANGGMQEIRENTTPESNSLVVNKESMIYFLGRKFVEMTSFLIFLPYSGPKFALSTIWKLFQGSSNAVGRKRKERGSLSEEVKYMELSPVKRKYGDRLSTSSEEGTLVEILHDYISEDDPDYVPNEHESEESSEESGNEENREESVKECLDLTQDLEEMGVSLSPESKRNVEKLKNESEMSKCQSTPKKTELSSTNDEGRDTKLEVTETSPQGKSESKATNTNAPEEKLQEISLKESGNEDKDKTAASKDVNGSKGSKIDRFSKSRRSSKSPLLEKLLSPGRRRSQKEKAKTGKDDSEAASVAEASTSKSEGNAKAETNIHAEKLTDSSKITDIEAKVDEATKSKGKSQEEQKKSEKAEISATSGEGHNHGNEPLSTITGPFDVFKFGGKKSK